MVRIGAFFSTLGNAFFYNRSNWLSRGLNLCSLLGLYMIGLYQWAEFMNWGEITFDRLDWWNVTGPQLAAWHAALQNGTLPFHAEIYDNIIGTSWRFLYRPDVNLSPQVLLLTWVSPGIFVLINTLILYTIGFLGLLKIRTNLRLSIAAFIPMFFLFNLNGHIIAHLSVGHLMWLGYFFLPFYILLVLQLVFGQVTGWKWTTGIALILFLVQLQGSFHIFIICYFFLLVLIPFFLQQWQRLVITLISAIFLSMNRFLPGILAARYGYSQIEFLSGFTTLDELLRSLVTLVPPERALDSLTRINWLVAWWEFDHYIGWVGLAFILFFGIIYWLRDKQTSKAWLALYGPIALLVFFSIGRLYKVFVVAQIPLLSIERVTSRLLLLPLLFLIIMASIGLQRYLDQKQPSALIRLSGVVLFLILLNDLLQHREVWMVNQLEFAVLPEMAHPEIQITTYSDPLYFAFLSAGWIITVLSGILLGVLVAREKKPMKS